jgi:hypothetical protein
VLGAFDGDVTPPQQYTIRGAAAGQIVTAAKANIADLPAMGKVGHERKGETVPAIS